QAALNELQDVGGRELWQPKPMLCEELGPERGEIGCRSANDGLVSRQLNQRFHSVSFSRVLAIAHVPSSLLASASLKARTTLPASLKARTTSSASHFTIIRSR